MQCLGIASNRDWSEDAGEVKKLVPNPEFADAPYELTAVFADKLARPVTLHRFKTPPPVNLSRDAFNEWVFRNTLPMHVEVEG